MCEIKDSAKQMELRGGLYSKIYDTPEMRLRKCKTILADIPTFFF